jgi:hypothetical protein
VLLLTTLQNLVIFDFQQKEARLAQAKTQAQSEILYCAGSHAVETWLRWATGRASIALLISVRLYQR